MKNYEKYKDEIKKYKGNTLCTDFIMPYILKAENCGAITCSICHMLQMLWLLEEYEEPETDWSKVEVDTPILVRNFDDCDWEKRHFAKYEDGVVYSWLSGGTSWSKCDVKDWRFAKLAENEL